MNSNSRMKEQETLKKRKILFTLLYILVVTLVITVIAIYLAYVNEGSRDSSRNDGEQILNEIRAENQM